VRLILSVLLGTATAITCLLATPVRAYESRITTHSVISLASGCVVPLSFTSTASLQPQSADGAPADYYADEVVSATQVINPQNALGVEDIGWAVLTETSVLTLSFPSPFISGVAAIVQNPDESNCSWVWITIRHYLDLAAVPIFTTTTYTYVTPGYPGWIQIGDGLSASMAPHRYVAISFNTITLVDAVYYVIPAKYYWMPVMMRNASY
jgi:hypothetical protein